MKKLIFSMAVITASIFASCSKDSDVATPSMPDTVEPAGVSVVTLTLTDDATTQSSATRAATATAAAWEKSLSSLTVFAFDNEDNLLVKRSMSSTELSSKSVSFALPKSTSGMECLFYAVANIDTSKISTKDALIAMLDDSAVSYNGTYAEVTSKAMRTGGFVMSGSTTQTVGAEDTTTSVAITIKRTVAKVALELSISDTFAASYPNASLTFQGAIISKAASQTPVIAGSRSTGDMNHVSMQLNTTPNYQFYIYENGDLAVGERVLLEVVASFDADGDTSTKTDLSEIIYMIELSGDGAGAITRNGCYNVVATVNGLVGQDCDVTISVAEWETPVTQSVNLGM